MPDMQFSFDVAFWCMVTGLIFGFGIMTTYMMLKHLFKK